MDDLLIDLAASMADVIGLQAGFCSKATRFVRKCLKSDVVISDLPVGYYPDDLPSLYQVASSQEHTYTHHLLMEQGLKYLKSDGYAIFLAASDLLTSPQRLIKGWLKDEVSLAAIIALPAGYFLNCKPAKSIFVLARRKEIKK